MPQSAIADRRAATAMRLTSLSRRWTAERGLHGFTVEQLCEEVGISRRTFFNYFPSKEECVLGVDESSEAERFAQRFLERGSRGWSAVVDDLVELGSDLVEESNLSLEEHTEFFSAINREPRLLARALGMSREREQQLAELIATREGASTGDLHVQAVISIFGSISRATIEHLITNATNDFRGTLTASLAALRDVLALETD